MAEGWKVSRTRLETLVPGTLAQGRPAASTSVFPLFWHPLAWAQSGGTTRCLPKSMVLQSSQTPPCAQVLTTSWK